MPRAKKPAETPPKAAQKRKPAEEAAPKTPSKKTEKSSAAAKAGGRKPKTAVEPTKAERFCTFCGNPPGPTRFLIAGPPSPGSNICSDCVEVCNKILLEADTRLWTERMIRLLVDNGHRQKTRAGDGRDKGKAFGEKPKTKG